MKTIDTFIWFFYYMYIRNSATNPIFSIPLYFARCPQNLNWKVA